MILLIVAAMLAGQATASTAAGPLVPSPVAQTSDVKAKGGFNIIFFLTDDMATYQLRHMPRTRRLIFRSGARFTQHFANVSLCCPSRASLFTGKYAHNTGIEGNSYPDGFHGFHTGDEASRTAAIALRRRGGYTTGLLGKYLNEYPCGVCSRPCGAPDVRPAGMVRLGCPDQGAVLRHRLPHQRQRAHSAQEPAAGLSG
jgi:hypothetical protein